MMKGKILFDQGHEEDYLGALMNKLIEEGYECDTLESPITHERLKKHTSFVIATPKIGFSKEELKSILHYWRSGGGILLNEKFSDTQDVSGYSHMTSLEKKDWRYHKTFEQTRLDYILLKRFLDYQDVYNCSLGKKPEFILFLQSYESGSLYFKIQKRFTLGEYIDISLNPSSIKISNIRPLSSSITNGIELIYPLNEFQEVPYKREGITYFNKVRSRQEVPIILRRPLKFIGKITKEDLMRKKPILDLDDEYEEEIQEIRNLNHSDVMELQEIIENVIESKDIVGISTYPKNRRAVGIAGDLFSDQYIEQDKNRKANLRLALNVFEWLSQPTLRKVKPKVRPSFIHP